MPVTGQATAVTAPPAGARAHDPARSALLALLRAYQALRSGHPSPCRFYPSCSAYAAEAVAEHGAWRGSLLAVRRVARCRPLGGHGVDPVPPAGPRPGGDGR
jgi:putative membrane protein insertion efficiency factor